MAFSPCFLFSENSVATAHGPSVPAHTGVAGGGVRLPCCHLLCCILEEDELKPLCKKTNQTKQKTKKKKKIFPGKVVGGSAPGSQMKVVRKDA